MNDSELMQYIRNALHLTQEEMAEKLGYSSQEVISAIETGKRQMSEPVRAHLRTIEKHEL